MYNTQVTKNLNCLSQMSQYVVYIIAQIHTINIRMGTLEIQSVYNWQLSCLELSDSAKCM